jgi:hypothetical protein
MNLFDFFALILHFINAVVVPLVFAIAFVVFIVGIVRMFIAGDDTKRKEGRTYALWGIIALFIMVSVWGLVNILVGTFGFQGQRRPPLPGFGSPDYMPGGNRAPQQEEDWLWDGSCEEDADCPSSNSYCDSGTCRIR